MPTHTCKKCGRITAWEDGEKNMQDKCGKCGHNHSKPEASGSNSTNLLSCPFCGGEGFLENDNDDNETYVGCLECFARGEWFNAEHEDRAIEAWNKRAI